MNIKIGKNLDRDIVKYLRKLDFNKIFLLTDRNIYKYHEKYIKNIVKDFDHRLMVIDSGEKEKNIDTVLKIYDGLIEGNFNRNDLFLGFGGGVVGDIGGFISSTYMRGIKYIQIPTSLLSQVDSSVGGKTGFDYKGYKNIIGSFYRPIYSFIDINLLKTLDNKNLLSGIGEVLKYGLIYDFNFYKYIVENKFNIINKDLDTLEYIVEKSIETKMYFVERDEKDFGLRRKLNFGHTIGHSIESFYDFKKYSHGQAVILGMQYEIYIGFLTNTIDESYKEKTLKSLAEFIEPIKFKEKEINSLLDIIKMDKKNMSKNISMILPVGEGRVEFFEKIDEDIIKKALKGEWIED